MYFRILLDEETGLLSYLLADLEAREAVWIDPRQADANVIDAMLNEHRLLLRALLCTDAHGEGPQAVASAHPLFHSPSLAGAEQSMQSCGLVAFGSEHLQVLSTPGHTPEGRSFRWRDRLFCGGLLAPAACPEAPGVAMADALWDSVVHTVFSLPPETLLFAGHTGGGWSVSNVLTQRKQHPWFAGRSRDEALCLMEPPRTL